MTDHYPTPVIRLTISTDRLPLAHQAGRIFERLSKAFDELAEVRTIPARNRPHLRLINVEVGSLWADMMPIIAVASTIVTAHDLSLIATTFTRRLARAARIMAGFEEGQITVAQRAAVNALAEPVAKDGSRQVNLQVVGDNNTVNFLTMSPELWGEIRRKSLRARHRSTRTQTTTHVIRPQNLSTSSPELGRPVLQVHDAISKSFTGPIRKTPEEFAETPTVAGRAQWLGNRWIVVPNGSATLMPMINDTIMQGRDSKETYPVEGRIVRHGPDAFGFRVLAIG